jgi:hypothetical protein
MEIRVLEKAGRHLQKNSGWCKIFIPGFKWVWINMGDLDGNPI